mgnify:CR=1 FL=1
MSTLAATNLKHASSASNNIVLDSSGNATFAGTAVPASSFLRNRIINGDMRIDQRNAGASISVTSTGFPVDRFYINANSFGVISGQRSTVVPTGFTNSALMTVTTARSSIAASDVYGIRQTIEGFNTADFGWGAAAAQTVTLSFWVRSSIAGTYTVSIFNAAFNRSYVATYTINSANTFEYKTVTVAGDITGTWATDNTASVNVFWDLGSGSDYQATANSWVASGSIRTSGSTNWISTSGATFYLTGVQLEVGSAATPFERRQYGQELMLCQRYYEKSYNTGTAPGSSVTSSTGQAVFQPTNANTTGGDISGVVFFRVSKRAAPTGYYWDLAGNASRVSNDAANNNKTISAGNVISATAENSYTFDFIVASATNNRAYWCWAAGAEL